MAAPLWRAPREPSVMESLQSVHREGERDRRPPTLKEAVTACVEKATRFYNLTIGLESEAVVALACPCPALPQDGPMCGLVALAMIAEGLNLQRRVALATAPLESHQPRRVDPVSADLLQRARAHAMTVEGEMFSSRDLAALLGETFVGHAEVVYPLTGAALLAALFKGGLVAVPYDAAPNNEPFQEQGRYSHWAVVVGAILPMALAGFPPPAETLLPGCYWQTLRPGHGVGDPDRMADLTESQLASVLVLARHGKSKHLAVWPLVDLLKSNAQLQSPSDKPQHRHLALPTSLLVDFNATAVVCRPPTMPSQAP